MKLEKKIKDKLSHELPYSPSYNEFAEAAHIDAKPRRKAPTYHSFKKKLFGGILIAATAIGTMAAIIPIVISANTPTEAIPYLKYRPKTLQRINTITEKTSGIYENFVEIVTKEFFSLTQEEETSRCLSLPDLFFCYSMLISISDSLTQTTFLEAIGAESMNQLQEASNELASYLVYLEKADEAGESDSGSVNLNGFFYDSSAKLKEGYDSYLQSFSENFNSYCFSSKPTKEIVKLWNEKEDTNDFCGDSSSLQFNEDAAISTVSSYALIDAFPKRQQQAFETAYKEGASNIDYYCEDGSTLISDVLEFDLNGKTVIDSSDCQRTTITINKTEIEIFLPKNDDVDSFATTIFDEKESREVTHENLKVYLPMFNVESSLLETAEKLFPALSGKLLGTNFIDSATENGSIPSLSQSTSLTLDYNGFKGSSIAPKKFVMPGEFTNYMEFIVDRPFVFSVSYKGVSLYYGKVHNPNYPRYSSN